MKVIWLVFLLSPNSCQGTFIFISVEAIGLRYVLCLIGGESGIRYR